MEGGHVGVKINDQIQNFQTKKGVRQRDPLSPIIFNIVVDMLEILIKMAKEEGQIIGVIPHLVMMGSRYLNMRTIRFYLWNTI
jgi:retron-type reverse transcriptase